MCENRSPDAPVRARRDAPLGLLRVEPTDQVDDPALRVPHSTIPSMRRANH